MNTATATIALIALLATAPASAGVYKCTDADGKVTFSQTACAVDAQPVDVNTHIPSAAETYQSQRKWNDIADQQDRGRMLRDMENERSRAMALGQMNSDSDRRQREQERSQREARQDAYNIGNTEEYKPREKAFPTPK